MRRGGTNARRCPHLCLFLLCSRSNLPRMQAPVSRSCPRLAFAATTAYDAPMLRFALLAALPILALLAAGPTAADEAKKKEALPGVAGNYSIVAPEPEPSEPPADASGTKKVGKWELTVSGYVWVQVGSASPLDGR